MRTRVKRSIVWKMDDDTFTRLVKTSFSVGDICRKLSGRKGGCIFSNIKRRIDSMNLQTTHFIDKRNGKYNILHLSKSEFMKRLKCETDVDLKWMKKKLVEFSLVMNECSECHLTDIWNNKPIVLHLDHIDGDPRNNSLSNIRLLCPNCHSQTETYGVGKNRKRKMVGDTRIELVSEQCQCPVLPLY